MTVSFRDRHLRPAFFYRIECDPVVRFWTGLGPRQLAVDSVETDGGVYYGVDFLAGAPNFNLLADGTADTLTMGLNGVNPRILDLIDLDADIVTGCEVNIAFVLFDEDYQIGRAPYWLQGFVVNKVGLTLAISGDATSDASHTASASMTLGYGDKRRKRPAGAYWTPDRAAIGDRGLEHVPALDSQAQRLWPPPGG